MTFTSHLLGGRYRLERLLGQGGMSDVYHAVDEISGESVAVKVVRSGDPQLARRFAQEARALEGFDHPGLVGMSDTGVSDGQAYLVMELVAGPNLGAVLRQGALPTDRTASLGAGLADALAYAHARGVVHRDVKPGNILLHPDGRASLADFGIARLVDGTTMTLTGTAIGTASYMAPEQLEGKHVGPAADVWSLGIVLLECLTGRRVYTGTPSEVVGRRLAGPVPIHPELPVPWKLLLSGMLDHRPAQRLSAAETGALLRSAAFAAPWHPNDHPVDGSLERTQPHDLTALSAAPTLGPDSPLVADAAAAATAVRHDAPSTLGLGTAAPTEAERTAVVPPIDATSPPGGAPRHPAAADGSSPVWPLSLHSPLPSCSSRPAGARDPRTVDAHPTAPLLPHRLWLQRPPHPQPPRRRPQPLPPWLQHPKRWRPSTRRWPRASRTARSGRASATASRAWPSRR